MTSVKRNDIKITDKTLEKFYNDNPTFDLKNFVFSQKGNVDSLKFDPSTREGTVKKLMAYQRLLNVHKDPDVAVSLLANGMDSARKITSLSLSHFTEEFASKLPGGLQTATDVYKNANTIKTTTMHLWANVNHLKKSPHYMNLASAPALQSATEPFENLSSYQDLFGSLNYCDCPECKSILGPAAYLTDLLRLIDKAITKPNTIPQYLSFNERRPDISQIKLTCGNTNNLVPYLQIVNEILEQTLSTSLNVPDVYKELTSRLYPFNLPFNLPLEQIRVYLKQNNTSLSAIFDAMQKQPGLTIASARERLGISAEELANLKKPPAGNLPAVLSNNYGLTITTDPKTGLAGLDHVNTFLSVVGISLDDLRNLLYENLNSEEIFNVSGIYSVTGMKGDTLTFIQAGDSVSATCTYTTGTITVSGTLIGTVVQGTWTQTESAVITTGYCQFTFTADCSAFNGNWNTGMGQPWNPQAWNGTRKTGTAAASGGIIAHNFFINTAFANPAKYLSLNLSDDKTYEQITNLDINTLDTLNRFIRLSQKLNWSYADLDWVLLTASTLVTPQSREINDDVIIQLAKIKRLETEYALPVSLLTTLWYDIKTIGVGSGQFSEAPFDQIFNGPEQVGFSGNQPYHPVYKNSYPRFANPLYQSPTISWSLGNTDPKNVNPQANTIVSGIPASTDSIRQIAAAAFGQVNTIELTVENLSVLYRHTMLVKALNIQTGEYLVLLKLLGLQQANGLIVTSLTPDQVLYIVETLAWMRSCGLNAFTLDYICNGTPSAYVNPGYDTNNTPSFIKALVPAIQKTFLLNSGFTGNGISAEASVAVFSWLQSLNYVTTEGLVSNSAILTADKLPDSVPLPDTTTFPLTSDQKNSIVQVTDSFRKNQKSAFSSGFASFLQVKSDFMDVIISQVTTLFKTPDYIEYFINSAPISQTFISSFIKTSSRFIIFYKSLGLNTTQINGIIASPTAYDQNYTFDPLLFSISMPVANISYLYSFTQLVSTFNDKKNLLVSYLGNPATCTSSALSAITGWHADQCQNLCNYFFGSDTGCSDVKCIAMMNRVFTITQELGIDVYFMKQLNDTGSWQSAAGNWDLYNKYSASLLQSVKASMASDAWPTVFRTMNGVIEELKRDAMLNLTVWIKGKQFPDITTADNLYEFLLIDVKRAGCQDISYIKQALNSAQLYLQRCRLNLERDAIIKKEDLPDIYWEWIMNYRIWEANREVFLYPENYIDPSLRASKTDLFRDLENQLSQGNVTKETVEGAYKKYLDAFQELGKLKYVDAYHCTVESEETGDTDTLFLFARTQNKPYTYYYISRQPGDIWSQWNEINIPINSDYITPVYAFSKLFIFWVELTTIQQKENSSDAQNSIITKATIKYSFNDFSGDWCQPQTLLADQVINISSANTFYGAMSPSMFDQSWLYWNKVGAMKLDKSNYPTSLASRNDPGKITVYYGPLLNKNAPHGSNKQTTGGPDFVSFMNTINEANSELDQLSFAGQNGVIPINQTIVINSQLEYTNIVDDNEFLILQNDFISSNGPSPSFTSVVSQLNNNLVFTNTGNSLSTNYLEGMGLDAAPPFLAPSIAVTGSFVNAALNINSNLSGLIFQTLQSGAVGILNQSGQVQPSLLATSTQTISTVCQGLTMQQAKFVRDTLFGFYYGSPYIFGQVASDNTAIIPVKNQPGWFIFQTDYESFLFESYQDTQFDTTFSKVEDGTLINEPFGYVTNTSFITNDIDTNTANKIYTSLQSPALGIVDTNGIVSLTTLNSITVQQLTSLLQGINTIQGAEVYSILQQSAKVALQYSSSGFSWDDNLYTLNFKTTRITTSAIQDLSRRLFTGGINSLLSLSAQQPPENVRLPFDAYLPGPQVQPPAVSSGEQVDFSGPYGNYYWELFFHGPMLVAKVLNNNQQFQDAEQWLQYIFNPTLNPTVVTATSFITDDINATTAGNIFSSLTSTALGLISNGAVTAVITQITPQQLTNLLQSIDFYQGQEVYNILKNNYLKNPLLRYWQFQPFRDRELEPLVKQLTNAQEINAYNTDPFDPHAIARIRIGAYEKTIVMQYVENLTNWGDSEYQLYTWESITSALMLYTYAYGLLGPRPIDLGACESEYPVSFSEILQKYSTTQGGIPQFLIDMENAISSSITPVPSPQTPAFNDIEAYFCVPENDSFISYWDTLESRMFNIRHCLNINGIAQPLPLFDPPINPMDLVRAAAAGNNVMDLASLLQPNIPPYRFPYMIEQAKNLTVTVTQLGNSLLSALEKNDAEGLALLQSFNEINILNLTTITKQQQITDLSNQLDALQQNLENAQYKEQYYSQLISAGLNSFEISDLALRREALIPQDIAIGINGVSIAGYLAPNIFGFADGGMKFGDAISAGASICSITAEKLNQSAGLVSTAGSYQRRQEEWQFQKDSTTYDIAQINKEISANQARIAIAQQELVIHQKNIEQQQAIDSYLKTKFTNQDMYQWMISRLSSLYFQTYNLAITLSLQAQATYQFELDSSDQFITFNYWDNLHKGLLAGESLMMSLQQMESNYTRNNTRLLEIEKTISMSQQFPEAFQKFKWGPGAAQGTLDFTLSEKLFDFDFPGHYCRKIKSISISIPAVIGPYQNLNATLIQNSNLTIMKADTNAVSYAVAKTVPGSGSIPPEPSADIVRQNWVTSQGIAISKGVDDSGMFVLDFNDPRYLPFEGTGAVSTWTLQLPPDTNRINFDSISDVIITVRYTAKDGGSSFATNVKTIYSQLQAPSGYYTKAKTFDLKQAFYTSWQKMFNTPPDAKGFQNISFGITDNYWLTNLANVNVQKLAIQMEVANNGLVTQDSLLQITCGTNTKYFNVANNIAFLDEDDLETLGFGSGTNICNLQFNTANLPDSISTGLGTSKTLDNTKLLDLAVVIIYTEKIF
ncbi:MAG: hypothetical protein K0S32_1275 [Bacteroidetes bacterium]|nr:hypothetical protein [Bacteroidota bacterium]